MRRVNISRENKRQTISFNTKQEFENFVWFNTICTKHTSDYVAEKVWDLNVGKSFTSDGYTYSIQSKVRVGNQLVL